MNMYKVRKDVSKVIFYFFVLALFAVFLSPFIEMVTTSFNTLYDAFTVPVKILTREWT